MELLFKNKTKNIIAIVSSALYFVYLIIMLAQSGISLTFQSANRLLLAAGIGVFLFAVLTVKMNYGFKKYILTLSFGLLSLAYLISSITAFITILFYLDEPLVVAMFALNFVILAGHILCFVSALFEFRNIKLLRLGAVLYIASTVLLLLLDFINVGGFEYFSSLPHEMIAISVYSAIKTVVILMFYISLLLFTTNKESE